MERDRSTDQRDDDGLTEADRIAQEELRKANEQTENATSDNKS